MAGIGYSESMASTWRHVSAEMAAGSRAQCPLTSRSDVRCVREVHSSGGRPDGSQASLQGGRKGGQWGPRPSGTAAAPQQEAAQALAAMAQLLQHWITAHANTWKGRGGPLGNKQQQLHLQQHQHHTLSLYFQGDQVGQVHGTLPVSKHQVATPAQLCQLAAPPGCGRCSLDSIRRCRAEQEGKEGGSARPPV